MQELSCRSLDGDRSSLRDTRDRGASTQPTERWGARGRVRECIANRILLLAELDHGGAGAGCGGLEQAGEWAGGHAGSDVLGVAGVLE
jgi:hypothetical protein